MPTSLVHRQRVRQCLRVAIGALSISALWLGVASAQSGSTWTEYQGGPDRTGSVADGPAPGYRVAWSTPIAPAGPGSRYGPSAPIHAGDVVVVVGPEEVVGVDIGSGEQSFTVDRDPGPSVPAATTVIDGNPAIVYTEGWGDGPPDPTAGPEESPEPDADDGTLAVTHVAAFDIETQREPWRPVELDGVSRTGVTVVNGSAFVGVNSGTVTAVDLSDGSVRWQQDLGATIGTSIAARDGLVLVGVQGDRDTQPAVVALDEASGEQRWRHEPTTASAVVSAVSTDGDDVFAVFAGLSETTIVAIGSLNSWKGDPNIVSYVASKHAVLGVVRSTALALGCRGIRVNAVAPGPVATEQDIADAVLFLSSPLSAAISGQLLPVDGGIL